jgi:hypothetical protein
MNIFGFFQKKEDKKIDELKEKMLKGKEQDRKDLKRLNQRIQIAVEQGSIEIVIRNVTGVLNKL